MRLARSVSLSAWVRGLVVLLYAAMFIALIIVWRNPVARHWLTPEGLGQLGRELLATPFGPLAVLAGYVVAVSLAVPSFVLITVGSLVFGSWLGMAYALAGMVSGAVVTYGAGRLLVGVWGYTLSEGRAGVLTALLQRRGVLAVALLRALPVAPFLMVNVTSGVLRIGFRDYVLGTVLGLTPVTIVLTLFMDRLLAVLRAPSPWTIGLAIVVWVVVLWAVKMLSKWLKRRQAGLTT